MKLLTERESAKKLQEVSRSLASAGRELMVSVNEDLGRSVGIARLIVALLGGQQSCFLWIRGYGAWPEFENIDLFAGLRAAMPDQRTLQEAPGQEFLPTEQERLVSYLQVILVNGWDSVLVGIDKSQRIAITHEAWFSIMHSDALATQTDMVKAFGLDHRFGDGPISLTTP